MPLPRPEAPPFTTAVLPRNCVNAAMRTSARGPLRGCLLAPEIGRDGIEVRIAQLGFAEGGHDAHAVAHDVLHIGSGEIGALLERGRDLAAVFRAQRSR